MWLWPSGRAEVTAEVAAEAEENRERAELAADEPAAELAADAAPPVRRGGALGEAAALRVCALRRELRAMGFGGEGLAAGAVDSALSRSFSALSRSTSCLSPSFSSSGPKSRSMCCANRYDMQELARLGQTCGAAR